MSDHHRVQRLNQLLLEELSRVIRRELDDPRVASVTVTGVDCTPDLRHADVYVRTLHEEPTAEEAVEGLEGAEGFLRGVLGRELHLRRIPELRFEVDRTLERAQRIESLLDQINAPDDGDGGE